MTREFLTTIAPYRELLLILSSMLVALWAAQALHAWRGSRRAKRRAERAGAGEDAAADMLEEAGYRVVERQARVLWGPLVFLEARSESGPLHTGGDPQLFELRADYLVEGDGQLLVAEVKTGEVAPSLETAATRRQLLEYQLAFAVDGVLLVSPEQGTIQRVAFPRVTVPGCA